LSGFEGPIKSFRLFNTLATATVRALRGWFLDFFESGVLSRRGRPRRGLFGKGSLGVLAGPEAASVLGALLLPRWDDDIRRVFFLGSQVWVFG